MKAIQNFRYYTKALTWNVPVRVIRLITAKESEKKYIFPVMVVNAQNQPGVGSVVYSDRIMTVYLNLTLSMLVCY
jgi:hypothetical protein